MKNGSRGMHSAHCRHTGPNHVGRRQQSLHWHGHPHATLHWPHWPLLLRHAVGWNAIDESIPAIVMGRSVDDAGGEIITGRGRIMPSGGGWGVR